MGFSKRTYEIAEEMTGSPAKPTPVLKYNGHIITSTQTIVFNKNDDNMKKVDHYRLRFSLSDFKNTKLRFVPSMADAMWAHTDVSKCPDSPCAMPNVFWVDDMDKNGEWIDVINMNMAVENFRFTLNFVEKSVSNPTATDYVPLDPTGGNQNTGGTGSGSPLISTSLATGVVTGVVAAIGAVTLASKAFVAQSALLYGIGGALVGLVVGFLLERSRQSRDALAQW